MANTDWLTTLLSGVSGAFTGYGQANERRASAAELARQIARQTELDARAQQQDAARQFSQGLQDEAALTNLGYVRGDIPKQFSGASMALPGMGAFDVGSAVDAMRVGPSRTTPDGTRFTLDRAQTPQARTMREAEMSREQARALIQQRAAENARTFAQQKELKQMEIGAADRRAAATLAARANADANKPRADIRLTPPQIEKMNELDSVLSLARHTAVSIGKATRDANGKPVNVTGRIGGVVPLPAWVRNAAGVGGENGMSARNLLGNLVSTVGQMRSGGAISPQEFDRLEAFLPTENDDESVVMVKLRNFVKTLEDIRSIRLQNYQRYGPAGSVATPASTGDMDLDSAIDSILSEGRP